MKIEEAIYWLGHSDLDRVKFYTAVGFAIEALKTLQNPIVAKKTTVTDGDSISRSETAKSINTWPKFGVDGNGRMVPWNEGLVPYVHLEDVMQAIENMPTVQPEPDWIQCSELVPEMHDAGILKKLGINRRSNKCIITVAHESESVVDNDAEFRDGEWYSNYLKFLKATKKPFEVTAWMPLPSPYKKPEDVKE